MSVEQMLAELGVETVADGITELDLALDALSKGYDGPALPWEESIEAVMQRIEGDLEMLVDANAA